MGQYFVGTGMWSKSWVKDEGYTSYKANYLTDRIPTFSIGASYTFKNKVQNKWRQKKHLGEGVKGATEFCISSLVNMIVFSLLLGATQEISNIIPIHDILLQSVYGGILSGLGVGVVFRTRSSQGGTDIIAAILKIKKNIEMKDTALAINGLIVLTGSFLFGLDLALYTLIGLFLNAYSMSFIKDAMNYQKSVMVMSNEVDLIAEDIMKSLVRGVTFLDAEGAYTHQKKKIIYTIVSSNEIPKIKDIALKYDKKAFISVNDVTEVKGRGFKAKDL